MGRVWNFSFSGSLFKRGSSTTRSSGVRTDRLVPVGQAQWVAPSEPYIPPVPLQPILPPVEFSESVGPLRIEGMINPATHQLMAFQIRFVPHQFPLDPAYATPVYSLAEAVHILGAHPAPHHMTFRPSHTVTITPQQPFAAGGEVQIGAIQHQDRWGRWNEVIAISYNVNVREPMVPWNGAAMLYEPPQHLHATIPLQIHS